MKVRMFIKKTLVVIIATILVGVTPASTYALSAEQLDKFAQNDIMFYDPDGGNCDSAGLGAYNGESTTGLSDQQASFVDTYHDIAATLSIEYGIPWETVVAQGILESASGSSSFARERNNFFGIGAFDSNPDNAHSFDSPEDGWRGYYENIRVTATYRNHGVFSGDAITNPYIYAQAIKDAGYASDPDYVTKLSKLISPIEARSKDNGWQSSLELSISHPEMLENAAKNAAGADSNSTSGSGSSQAVCSFIGSGKLTAGGMTLAEAQQFMQPYRDVKPRDYGAQGSYISKWKINDTSGCQSDLENCVAFVQYFICEYAKVCMGLPDGKNVVDKLLESGKGFMDGGTTPRAYAIFSTTRSVHGLYDSGNHTGVVLGVDTDRGKIVIGEAGCGSSYDWTNAHEYDLSKFTDGSFKYAYTDGLIGF